MRKLLVTLLLLLLPASVLAGTYTLTTTVEQDAVLKAASSRTGRPVQELIQNALQAWLGLVANELKTPVLEEKFKALSDADKEALFKAKAYYDSLTQEEKDKIRKTLGLP